MPYTILSVEDDADIQSYLQKNLLDKGYSVLIASTGTTALKVIENISPDLALLDVLLPDITGESLCIEIKKKYPDIPVIFLTAQDSPSNIVHGFDIGADDYITKPFELDVLLARIKVRLKKDKKIASDVIKAGDLVINRKTYEVKRSNKEIHLTPKEFKLLEYFINNPNIMLTREQILAVVWQYNFEVESRVVDIYTGTLRKKIDLGHKKKFIHSARGFGYMFKS